LVIEIAGTFAWRKTTMQSVVIHIDGKGVAWALAKCRDCRNVHKYLMTEALAGPVTCKTCSRSMAIEGAVIDAADGEQVIPPDALSGRRV
jgi:hypothetical protein